MTEHAQQAADLLGSDHPVPRLAETIHAVRRQALVCVAFTLALALLSWPHPTRSLPLTASAVLVDLLLLGTCAALRHERTTRIRQLIATSGPDLPLIDVQRRRCDCSTRVRANDSRGGCCASSTPPSVGANCPQPSGHRRAFENSREIPSSYDGGSVAGG